MPAHAAGADDSNFQHVSIIGRVLDNPLALGHARRLDLQRGERDAETLAWIL
jgi:hypothetical protein